MPGCPSLGVSHQPWKSLLFRPIRWHPPWKLLLHIHCYIFLASLHSQQEALLTFFFSLYTTCPDDTEVWGQSLWASAPTCGSFLELGPRAAVVEALLYTLLWPLHNWWKSCRLWWNCSFVFVWEVAEDSNVFTGWLWKKVQTVSSVMIRNATWCQCYMFKTIAFQNKSRLCLSQSCS